MERIYTSVIEHRKLVLIIFMVALVAALIMKPFVKVNYDIKDYLPSESKSTVSLKVMESQFGSGIPNARVMIRDVSVSEARDYQERLSQVDGVLDVQWLDDSTLISGMPVSFLTDSTRNDYFRTDGKDGSRGDALMTLTIDKEKRLEAVKEVRSIIGEGNCMTGDAVSTAVATENTVSEIAKVLMASILFVLLILIVTTRSWLEPVVILIGLGVAIMINAGTNLIFGEISFVTNASCSILQLAVSLDYSVFLMHRYESCRKLTGGSDRENVEASMVQALCKSTGTIASSGLTTVIGFLALLLMRLQIGPDMGIVLAKGVLISLITVFTFLPALIVTFSSLLDRTRHKNFLPDFSGLGRLVRRVSVPAIIIFALAIVPAFVMMNSNSYYYGASHIYNEKSQVGSDTAEIEKEFGQSDTYAVMVPKGNTHQEDQLIKDLKQIPEITDIKSRGETLSSLIPADILPDFIGSQLVSDEYSRIVLYVDIPHEGTETFNLIEKIRSTCAGYYGDDYLMAGDSVSTYDVKETVTADLLKVNIVAVLAVLMILIIMFRRIVLPLILVACIETAIWVNLAVPLVLGHPVFYIAYLIISSVQLGATVDYAILMTDRYRENRLTMDRNEAVVTTVKIVTPSILTSGSALIIVGFLMGFISSHQILAQLGIFIGRGALCSLLIVLFVLPGLLRLFDRFCTSGGSSRFSRFSKRETS